jgi:hypothetical protein
MTPYGDDPVLGNISLSNLIKSFTMSTIQDLTTENHDALQQQKTTIAMEMFILTADYEVSGMVYVNPRTKPHRRVSELLNNSDKRFLALTDARLTNRNGKSTARLYPFLQLHIDSIILIHPASQSIVKSASYTENDASRFNELREKF